MRVIAKRTLREFWEIHPDSEQSLIDWYDLVIEQNWASPNELKSTFGNTSIIDSNRVVFNIKGNDYRLITYIDYKFQIIFVMWVGTHSEYDKIDARKINFKRK
ncbi:MAG: type II toxin-antitoxin system HigB family toxin [Spirosomataceae bacterium]